MLSSNRTCTVVAGLVRTDGSRGPLACWPLGTGDFSSSVLEPLLNVVGKFLPEFVRVTPPLAFNGVETLFGALFFHRIFEAFNHRLDVLASLIDHDVDARHRVPPPRIKFAKVQRAPPGIWFHGLGVALKVIKNSTRSERLVRMRNERRKQPSMMSRAWRAWACVRGER